MISRKDFLRRASWLAVGAGCARAAYAEEGAPSGLTAEVADFAIRTRWEDLPADLVALGKKHILDSWGLALAGGQAETAPLVKRYLAGLGVQGAATVLSTGERLAPRFAAFANGVAIHADDFDDTQLAVAPDRVYGLLTHPSVGAFSAALAVAEARAKSGRDLMLAYHLGVEVETKISEAINPRSYETGFHSTSMCDPFGAATSAAKLAGLDAKALRNAYGVAAAQAGGLRENFGTMTKPFQAGHGAEAGVTAAELAGLGWTAAENVLEAPRGFFAAFGGGFDAHAISGKLGKPWSFLSPGVSIKPYPSGSLTHPAMDETLRLARAAHITSDDVAEVRVGTNKAMLNTLIHHRPKDGLQAKFSMEYCIAAILLDGNVGLLQFTDAAVNRKAAQDLLQKVDFYNSPEADAAGSDKMRSMIEIKLKDGKAVHGQADFARGSPQKPMTFDDAVDKFRGCADYAKVPKARVERIVAMVRDLDRVDDMQKAVAALFT